MDKTKVATDKYLSDTGYEIERYDRELFRVADGEFMEYADFEWHVYELRTELNRYKTALERIVEGVGDCQTTFNQDCEICPDYKCCDYVVAKIALEKPTKGK